MTHRKIKFQRVTSTAVKCGQRCPCGQTY